MYHQDTNQCHRAMIKRLPEMMFTLRFRHECYQSHQTWQAHRSADLTIMLSARFTLKALHGQCGQCIYVVIMSS